LSDSVSCFLQYQPLLPPPRRCNVVSIFTENVMAEFLGEIFGTVGLGTRDSRLDFEADIVPDTWDICKIRTSVMTRSRSL